MKVALESFGEQYGNTHDPEYKKVLKGYIDKIRFVLIPGLDASPTLQQAVPQ